MDGRADIYATGAILYEMLAGEPPFVGPSARIILTRSLTESPRTLSRGARRDCPVALDSVVQKALAKNPVDRYATGEALIVGDRQHAAGGDVVGFVAGGDVAAPRKWCRRREGGVGGGGCDAEAAVLSRATW